MPTLWFVESSACLLVCGTKIEQATVVECERAVVVDAVRTLEGVVGGGKRGPLFSCRFYA